MKSKFKQAVVCLVVVMLVSVSSIVYAEYMRDFQEKKSGHREKVMQNLIEELNLTPEQQEQLRAQREKNKEKVMEFREKLRSKRSELKGELEKQDIDRRKIYSIVAEVETLIGDQLEQKVEIVLAMREILTLEQFKKLQEKREQLLERKGDTRDSFRGKKRY